MIVEGVDDVLVGLVLALVCVTVAVAVALFQNRRRELRHRSGSGERRPTIEATLSELRHAAADRPHRIPLAPDDAAGQPREADLQCPVCLDLLTHAVELAPCGHALCGSCAIDYWSRLGRDSPCRCPIDRSEVHMLVASHTIRALVANLPHDGAGGGEEEAATAAAVRRGIAEYNAAFAGRSLRSFIVLGWHSFMRALADPGSLRLLHRVYLVVTLVLVVGYALMPYDLIPEGAMGIFFLLGFVDDLLFAVLAIVLVGNILRVANEAAGADQ